MRIRSCLPAGYPFPVLALLLASAGAIATERGQTGIKGDPAAVADAKAMVETMGGRAIWSITDGEFQCGSDEPPEISLFAPPD